jgi:predicted nucleic acid-binding Zn ribbon protein
MTDWHNETRHCACGKSYKPKRDAQRHCSAHCRDLAKKRRKRSGDKNMSEKLDLSVIAGSGDTPAKGPHKAFEWPVCNVCRLWAVLPQRGLPRHLFCIAVRKAWREKPELARAA